MPSNVLLVDDDINLILGLRRSLRSESFEIHLANSAEQAMGVLEKTPIDLVVSDQHMPGVGGTDFLAQIRLLFPGVVRILMTGDITAERAVEAVNLGHVFRLLVKPIAHGDLVLALRQGIQQKLLLDRCQRALRTLKKQNRLLAALIHADPDLIRLTAAKLAAEPADAAGEPLDQLGLAIDQELTHLSSLIPTFQG